MSLLPRLRPICSLTLLVLVCLVLMHGCDSGPTGIDARRFPCAQDDECISGFVCRAGECRLEGEPVDEPDGGGPDGGPPDSGVPDAGPVVRPTQLGFVTPPHTTDARECSPQVVLETRTADGGAAPVASSTSVSLISRNRDLTFYTSRNCVTAARTSVTVPAGDSRVSFYFRGNSPGTFPIEVAATGLTGATQNATIRPGPPAVVAFVSPAQTVPAGACSAAVVLEVRDASGAATSFSSPTAAGVTATPADGLTWFSDSGCATVISDATFAAGATRTSFYFKGKTGGPFTLSAMPPGLAQAGQEQTILPVVRTGSCTLEAGALSVNCPIFPPQREPSRTMLLFQANSDSGDASSSVVRCTLTNASTVTCARAGGGSEAWVDWQTAELASGLKVQHLEASCTNQSTVTVPMEPVASLGSTFLLVSSQSEGTTVAADDFFTATLPAPHLVELRFGTACASGWRGSIQVVEFTGASVTRGVTGAVSGTQLVVTNLPPVEPATTALLFTYRVSSAAAPGICDRMLRGELTSPTTLTFSRSDGDVGCEDAVIEAISWERINLGARGMAQHLGVAMDDFTTNIGVPIPLVVDPTRTLVFASNQALSGQAGGETDYADDDLLGAAVAHHALSSPTLLEVHRDSSVDADVRWFSTVLQLEP